MKRKCCDTPKGKGPHSDDCPQGKVGLPMQSNSDADPDWSRSCSVCGSRPIVPVTGMCGVCTFGEADCAGGNW